MRPRPLLLDIARAGVRRGCTGWPSPVGQGVGKLMVPIKVLVVDDDFVYQSLLCRLLNSRGDLRVVGRAFDGEQAISLYRSLSPDVILMDLSLPRLDGLNSIRRIKKINPTARVIVLTIKEASDWGDRSKAAGADAFLAKGSPTASVAETIRRLCPPGKAHRSPSPNSPKGQVQN